jgi:hypothetical protein
MEKIPTTIDVREQARKLVALLDDPHPGLSTWIEARNGEAVKLYKMLGFVFEKMVEFADRSHGSTER